MSYVIGEDRETGETRMLGRPGGYHAEEPILPLRFKKQRYRKVWRYFDSPPREILASPFWKNIRVVKELPECLR